MPKPLVRTMKGLKQTFRPIRNDNVHLTRDEYRVITKTLNTALLNLDTFFKTGAEELDSVDAGRSLIADVAGMLRGL